MRLRIEKLYCMSYFSIQLIRVDAVFVSLSVEIIVAVIIITHRMLMIMPIMTNTLIIIDNVSSLSVIF